MASNDCMEESRKEYGNVGVVRFKELSWICRKRLRKNHKNTRSRYWVS